MFSKGAKSILGVLAPGVEVNHQFEVELEGQDAVDISG
jgi:phosphotransferase system HPr-like phosphotransfer protein